MIDKERIVVEFLTLACEDPEGGDRGSGPP